MPHLILVADIGGTSSRLALVGKDGVPTDIRIHRNDDFPGFEALIETDIAARAPGSSTAIGGAVLAVAGPTDGETVKLTNRDWMFTKRGLRRHFGWQKLEALNDFEALAYGVPALGAEDLFTVGYGKALPKGPMLICGPGTGFGVAGLLTVGRRTQAITGEGGRARLGAVNSEEARLLAHLVRELGTPVVEHALSGSGLARIHYIFSGEKISPEAVIAGAKAGDEEAVETCRIFLRLFGRVAGDLALTINARGGVYLAGGVSAALAPFFAESEFREMFEDHPPHRPRLAAMPIHVITHTTPALIGCGQIAGRLAATLKPGLHVV